MKPRHPESPSRRLLLQGMSALAATSVIGNLFATEGSMKGFAASPIEKPRLGLIGTGQRGSSLLRDLMQIENADVVAVCDTDPVALDDARSLLSEAGRLDKVKTFGENDYSYRKMLEIETLDAVIIATPWEWHAPMSIDAMQAEKHAFVEVPMATTIEDMWQMVEVSEATQRHCMMMENVCYGRTEMMVLNMAQQGLFGEITHGEGAYIHDLRFQMKEIDRGTGSWRTPYHEKMRGNIYPTHGLGPIAQYMKINRGDRFDYLTSMSSPALGRANFAENNFPEGHQRRSAKYIKGDMNSTLLQTVKGRSILVQYDTTTARPYSRLNLLQGTEGAFAGFPDRIALEFPPPEIEAEYRRLHTEALRAWEDSGREGNSPRPWSYHRWDHDIEKWYALYDHPLWKRAQAETSGAGGHGGMDLVMLWRMVECLQKGLPVDQDVYDGAAWSSLFPLTHESVINKSKSVDVPDFTRGAWKA